MLMRPTVKNVSWNNCSAPLRGSGDLGSRHRDKANRGLASQPMSTTIQQIEFELEKAERGMAMPYDAERVMQLRSMLREARKQKLSAGLGETGEGSAMTSLP